VTRPVVALLGDLNVDVTIRVAAVPPPGGEAHAETALTLGGSAALTARWLAALGCEVRLAAAIGEDPFGDWVRSALSQEGVLTSWLQRVQDKPTGLCFALVHPDGERALLAAPGACRRLSWDAIPPTWLDGVEWLHLSGYAWAGEKEREAAEDALQTARQRSIPVSLDPGAMAASLRDLDLAPFQLLLPNRREIAELTGHRNVRAGTADLRCRGARWVGAKLDSEGCLVAGPRGDASVPALQVKAVNTTGAGDAFNAGAIVGILSGWEPEAIAVLANLLGGAAALAGGGGVLPSLPDLLSLLEQAPGASTLGTWLRDRWTRRDR